jgi:EmrB/QacA subfamily drug resistance transporter
MSPHLDPERQHYGVTLAVLATAALAFALLQTMVAPALPAIQRELGASTTSVTWVLTVYLLTASIATPLFGRLGDIFGKERMLVVTLVLFALGCVISAMSNNLFALVLGRAVQGAAGATFPLAIGIIRDEFPRERVATGIGLISATFGIGSGVGVVLSGLIVDHLSYEWIFWLGVAITIPAIVCTHFFVPESPVKTPARIDWTGAALLSVGLSALLLAVSEGNRWGWDSVRTVGLIVASIAVLAIWARFETKTSDPLVDMRLLRLRGVWTTNLTGFLIGFGMFGSFILIPQFVQAPPGAGYGFGADVTAAGLFMLPSSLVMLFAGPLAGNLSNRVGAKVPLLVGVASVAVSFLMLVVAHEAKWEFYVSNALLGLGLGMSFAAMANLIIQAVPQRQTGEATGMNTIMRTVGGAIGAQVAAVLVGQHVLSNGIPAEQGYIDAFALGAGAVIVALLAGMLIPGRPRVPLRAPEPARA